MPGGHLASSIALAAGSYAAGASPQFAAGAVLGGFFIDFDHYLDYLVFEGQWRRPSPRDFLRHYFELRVQRVVLPLHSLELMAVLTVVAVLWGPPLLLGYVAGAAMHLVFDILVNGEHVLRLPILFYSFAYRAHHRFVARSLMDPVTPPVTKKVSNPYREFFTWKPTWKKERDRARDRETAGEPALPGRDG
jgi:hypothetical protein